MVVAETAVADNTLLAAAERGGVGAVFALGERYEEGAGGACDVALAINCYRWAAERGWAQAQVKMGEVYANGIGVARCREKAREWLDRAGAQTDDMDAVAKAAHRYYHGFGEGCDWFWGDGAAAARLARIAAVSGHAEAQYIYAEMLYGGDNMPQDKRAAREWYRAAARQGHEMAWEMLQHRFGETVVAEEDDGEAATSA